MHHVQAESSSHSDDDAVQPTAVAKNVRLRMYVAGSTLSSLRAIERVLNVCDQIRTIAIQVEIVDVLENPEAAGEDDIRALPVVVWKEPSPKWTLDQGPSDVQHLEPWLEMLAGAVTG